MPDSLRLLVPSVERHADWLSMAREFGPGQLDGGGLPEGTTEQDLADGAAFARWIDLKHRYERNLDVPEGRVPDSLRWIERDGRLVGTIQLRHRLNGFLLSQGGHIGYAVRPSARRRGNAAGALRLMLDLCRDLAINPVLITCANDNVGSAAVIESCGGRLEDVRHGTRRYWIDLPGDQIGLRPVGREGGAMVAGERLAWFAPDYPRDDDLDGIRTSIAAGADPGADPEVTLWSARHILLEGSAVGTVGFYGPPEPAAGGRPEVEIGYGLVPAARGRGVITEVLRRVLAETDREGVVVRAHVEPDNAPSRRALLRAGFTQVGPDTGHGLLFRRVAAASVPTPQ